MDFFARKSADDAFTFRSDVRAAERALLAATENLKVTAETVLLHN